MGRESEVTAPATMEAPVRASKSKRVAIVGAGVSGLAAARTLAAAGHFPVLFERTERVGGRVATFERDGYIFDAGATTLAPRGRAIEAVMFGELERGDLVRIELPILAHSSLRVTGTDPAMNKIERFAYAGGNASLPQRLAIGLDVRLESRIESIEPTTNGCFGVLGEDFESVVLAVPTPEAHRLLTGAGEHRPTGNAFYRPCLVVMLGFAQELPPLHYHALVDPDQRHPLTWLSLESRKCPGRAPEGHTAMVAQMGPQFSTMRFDDPEQEIIEATLDYIVRLYGKEWNSPDVVDVKRWRLSQPETTALFDAVNHPNARIVVAGDGVIGGRVEYAYDSGVRAAKLLIGGA